MQDGYLIDTQALIWFFEGNPSLPVHIRNKITDSENRIFLSIASLWEMAIKVSIGKLKLSQSLERIIARLDEEEILLLAIEKEHVLKIVDLEFHHKDPFDRLIIAQAIVEGFTVFSCDEIFGQYDVRVEW